MSLAVHLPLVRKWKEEKDKVSGKLESIEKRQSETEGERKRGMKQLEERVRTLELRIVREGEVAGQRQEARRDETEGRRTMRSWERD